MDSTQQPTGPAPPPPIDREAGSRQSRRVCPGCAMGRSLTVARPHRQRGRASTPESSESAHAVGLDVFVDPWAIETCAPVKTDVESLLPLAGDTPAPVCAEPGLRLARWPAGDLRSAAVRRSG